MLPLNIIPNAYAYVPKVDSNAANCKKKSRLIQFLPKKKTSMLSGLVCGSFLFLLTWLASTSVSAIDDWLITPVSSFPDVTLSDTHKCTNNPDFSCITLDNSLISRTFVLSPNFFTLSFASNLVTPYQEIIRSPFSPEAIVGFNQQNYSIGGVSYINNSATTAAFWDSNFLALNNTQVNSSTVFMYDSHSTSSILTNLYEWTPGTRHSFEYLSWPPKGLKLSVLFKPPAENLALEHIQIVIEYDMLQGMPILTKQLRIISSNATATANLQVTYLQVEYLKTNVPFGVGEQDWAYVVNNKNMVPYPGLLWLETDYAHGAYVDWLEDPDKQQFLTNNYGGYEPMAISYFAANRATTDNYQNWSVRLAPDLPGTINGTLVSFRTLELIFDNEDQERQGLARRRLMTVLSPAITESPIYTQTTNMSNASLHRMIDQCVNTGFELLAFSFDSNFDMETTNITKLNYYQTIIDYAVANEIEIGGYDLMDMGRNISQYNHINTAGKPEKGLCFASEWVNNITGYYNDFVDRQMTMIITDGPYPGWTCSSTEHRYHDGYLDSAFRQEYLQNEWYLYFHNRGVYIHSPDKYYYFAANRNKYPYNEHTTTLPRWWDLTIYRQLMYDNSYVIPVTAGWMFLPMTAYHNGGSDAVFEPLEQNLADYSFALGQYFSYSVAATIRGYELYDTNSTFEVVKYWADYYRLHRQILMSDIIHVRRPDNQYLDAILHVNHEFSHVNMNMNGNGTQECAMLIVFNPLMEEIIDAEIEISLYYSGAKDNIYMSYMDSPEYKLMRLENGFNLVINVTIQARNISWWTFKSNTN